MKKIRERTCKLEAHQSHTTVYEHAVKLNEVLTEEEKDKIKISEQQRRNQKELQKRWGEQSTITSNHNKH